MDIFVNYAPIVVVVLMFLIQERIVVTPEQLEKKHREIIQEVEKRFGRLGWPGWAPGGGLCPVTDRRQ